MKEKGFIPDQIIGKLREEVLPSEKTTAGEPGRKPGITEHGADILGQK